MKSKQEHGVIKKLDSEEIISQLNNRIANKDSFASPSLKSCDIWGDEISYKFPKKILTNQRDILKAEMNILGSLNTIRDGLERINQTSIELKNGQLENQYPKSLQGYLKKTDELSKIKIKSIIYQLQYHLDLSASPGTLEELAPFKEGKERIRRKKGDAIKIFHHFIALDNQENALVAICMNPGVRECICQLAVHNRIKKKNQTRCINLLLAYENRLFSEVYATHLSMYQLEKMEQMFIMHQEELKELKQELGQMHSLLKEVKQKINIKERRAIPRESNSSSKQKLFAGKNRLFSSGALPKEIEPREIAAKNLSMSL